MTTLKSDLDFKNTIREITSRRMKEAAKRRSLAYINTLPFSGSVARVPLKKYQVSLSVFEKPVWKIMPKMLISIKHQGYFYRCQGCSEISNTMTDFSVHVCRGRKRNDYYPIQCFDIVP